MLLFLDASFGVVCAFCVRMRACVRVIIIIIIIIIVSLFKEDNVFSHDCHSSIRSSGDTDIDYYRIFFGLLFVSVAMLVWRNLLGEEKPVLAL